MATPKSRVVSIVAISGLAIGGLLSNCAVPTSTVQSSDTAENAAEGLNSVADDSSEVSAEADAAAESEDAVANEAIACRTSPAAPEPLKARPNEPIFNQFNFQPESIRVSDQAVEVDTPYYTFSFCKSDRAWTILSTDFAQEDFDYEQYLADLAEPEYKTVKMEGESYKYRVRLDADWINEQRDAQKEEQAAEDTPGPTVTDSNNEVVEQPAMVPGESSPEESAVYFEMEMPDGTSKSTELYTLEELQDAQIGASLGTPRLSGAVETDDGVWFAATASQGEGDNGLASLIHYSPETGELKVEQPEAIQGDQITAIAATGSGDNLTLWLGTMRSGEGNPTFPANGLIAYQPETQKLKTYTVTNSQLVGAIPHQLSVSGDTLWIGTGNGVCGLAWKKPDRAKSWDCWRFATTATLPADGVDLYPSFLAETAATTLTEPEVEVLWANQPESEYFASEEEDANSSNNIRYEVVYEPGFEAQLSQGGYRVANEVARRIAGDNPIFWPGRDWHWQGDRFVRGFDEVPLNLVGGGPQGLMKASSGGGFSFDHNAIRGAFDLLSLTPEATKVRYYAGWIDSNNLEVYPTVVAATPPKKIKPNPLTEMAADLPPAPGP